MSPDNKGCEVNEATIQVTVDPALCAGCRFCELACSLHHTGTFRPASSSIRISRSNHTAEVRWSLEPTCDLCTGEPEPLCARYCQYDAIAIGGRP